MSDSWKKVMESILAVGADFAKAFGSYYLSLFIMMCVFFFGLATLFLPDPRNTPPEQVHNANPSVLEQRRKNQ